MPDTATPCGEPMLTVLGGLAEFERSLIPARTQAGVQGAEERGVIFGRSTKLNAKQRRIIAERYAAGETAAALAREFEVGEATVWRALKLTCSGAARMLAFLPNRVFQASGRARFEAAVVPFASGL